MPEISLSENFSETFDTRWYTLVFYETIGMLLDAMEELHIIEQCFIKIKSLYSIICQIHILILTDIALERYNFLKNEKHALQALASILFYSVCSYFTSKICDICQRPITRPNSTPSNYSTLRTLFKIVLEWLKAIVVVICLREQGIQYDPSIKYTLITFTYYLCTEKIFLEIIPMLIELLRIDYIDNMEHLYVPVALNVISISIALTVLTMVYIQEGYSNFLLSVVYFGIYLRIKDIYFNYYKVILDELQACSTFRTATDRDIENWNDICAVCLNRMSKAKITPCRHLFHPMCLRLCLKNSLDCPLCKSPFLTM